MVNYRFLLSLFPIKVANSIFARTINKLSFDSHSSYFTSATLKYAPGLKMDLFSTDIGHRYIAFTGVYENSLSEKICAIAKKEGGLLVDVGANYGYFSLLWTQFSYNRAFSFEASPKNFQHLKANVELNNLSSKITALDYAVSDQEGMLTFDIGPKDQTGWGGLNHLIKDNTNASAAINVSSVTLDNFVKKNGIDKITVLKIDTEGSDVLVLQGAKELIENNKIKHIFWENNSHRMLKLGLNDTGISKLLCQSGYTICEIDKDEFYAFI